MPAQDAAAEFAGDENRIAGPCATARQAAALMLHVTERGDADHERTVPAIGIAAGNGAVKFSRQRQHAFIQPFGQRLAALPRQPRHERRHGRGGHRGQVTQVHRQCLATDSLWLVL